ncbi:hypothetical protein DAPK24_033870 [Pichia kluyveri]|uniref:Uncharacterized protein n=1 Tax=Pichia kluyveri TaxID=36015 RepID=A0AAV5R706_PICKL|nr:hypothetical protein DAPK24_033870 [Pichia kluyveri]
MNNVRKLANLQKYFLYTDTSITKAPYFVSIALEIKVKQLIRQKLGELVSNVNKQLTENSFKMKAGHYDHIQLNYTHPPCNFLRLDLPYDNICQIDLSNNDVSNTVDPTEQIYRQYFENQIITTGDLELDTWWPLKYTYLAYGIQTVKFHVTLLPNVLFNEPDNAFKFFQIMKNSIGNTNIKFPVKFNNKLKVLSKYNYEKFFLALCIDREDPINNNLKDLLLKISDTREMIDSPFIRGNVIGEMDDNHIIDWKNSLLHTSIGVSNVLNNDDLRFGPFELFFLNKVLLGNENMIDLNEVFEGSLILTINS